MIYLMVGVPGSGKSTWLKENAKGPVISRDEVRFSFIQENDEYFSKEDDVFREFVKRIQEKIDSGCENIYIDATHINKKSRYKILRNLNIRGHEVCAVVMTTPFDECLLRNSKRQGRSLVPRTAMISMIVNYSEPDPEEESLIGKVWRVI